MSLPFLALLLLALLSPWACRATDAGAAAGPASARIAADRTVTAEVIAVD